MTTRYVVPTNAPHALPPAARGYPVLGVFPRFMRAPVACMTDAAQYGPVVYLGMNSYLVHHPDGVKYILQENNRNYDNRDTPAWNKLRPLLGNGLVLNSGQSWLQQRRLMQPAFHRKRIATLTTTMTDESAAMIARWQAPAARGTPLDILAETTNLTMQIILKTMFSTDLGDDTEAVAHAMTTVLERTGKRLRSLASVPERWPTPGNRAFRRALHTLDAFVYRIIAERRRNGKDMDDLLGMLLAARDEETGEGMSDRQLRDETMTMFVAGHETTSTLLAWIWHLVAAHPDVERRLHAEVGAALDGRTPTAADLSALPYLRMVIDETLRLYPPGWILTRSPEADDEVGGYRIPAKSVIFLSPYLTHRHPDYWENADTFDPERFAPEHAAGYARFAYWPFGGGPRQCIGNNFALMEAQLIVAMVAQSYRLQPLPGTVVEPTAGVTLQPRGLRMTVHPR